MKWLWSKSILRVILTSLCCVTLSFASSPSAEGIQVYQKNLHESPEHKQNLADDIDRYRNADNIWDTLRSEFTLPHYEDNPRIQEQIDWYMNNQDFLYRSASRAAPYLYFILQQVRKRHLPAEVALLPVFESSYNPFAYSSAGAAGIWQMMPATASGYGIKQNWWYDGRRDVIASTKAALNYLKYLGDFFDGNWLLAIAAYDTGEGNILSAIKRNTRAGENTDFWSLPVAQETQVYIPKLLALAIIISNPDKYPIELPYVRNAPYLAQVDLGAQIDLKHAAELAGLSLKELKTLNPGYNRSAMGPNGPYKLILTIENVEQFTENLSHSPQYRHINWIHHKVRYGESLASIAQHYSTNVPALKKINPKLASNLKPGTSLIVPRTSESISRTIIESQQDIINTAENTKAARPVKKQIEENEIAENEVSTHYVLQPGDTLYMVRNGDNINKVAKRFHIGTKKLSIVNQLSSNADLTPGKQLIIPTHSGNNNDSKKYSLTPGDTVYMVRKGDTIEKIARHYHTTPSEIRLTNLLAMNQLKEGDQIVIPTHA